VEIAYTGLRPGEKLFEELFNAAEEYERTEHGKIFVARNGVTSSSAFDDISKLVAAADEGKTDEMRECLAELLPDLGLDISSTGGPPRTTVGGMQIAAVEKRRAHAGSDAG
jgi:FlaA1/EpsC-like NDP-sugar epimerase